MDGKELIARLDDIQSQIDHLYSLHGQQPRKVQLKHLKLNESSCYVDPKTGHLMVKENQGRPVQAK